MTDSTLAVRLACRLPDTAKRVNLARPGNTYLNPNLTNGASGGSIRRAYDRPRCSLSRSIERGS
jgi:hypothetical protein